MPWRGLGWKGGSRLGGGGRGPPTETPPFPAGISRWGACEATSGASGWKLLCWHPVQTAELGPGVAPQPSSEWGLLRTPR